MLTIQKEICFAEHLLLILSYSRRGPIYSVLNIEIINLDACTTRWKPGLLERLTQNEWSVKFPSAPLLSLLLAKYMQSTSKDLWITQCAYAKLIFFPHHCNCTAFIKINRILTVYFKATASTRMCVALTGRHGTRLLSLPIAPALHNIHLGNSQASDNNYLHPS